MQSITNNTVLSEHHVRAFLRESTVERLEKILDRRIRSQFDLRINEALDKIQEIKRNEKL